MSASIRSIGREAGVSATVVSRLFRGDPELRISEKRRAQIFEARDRLGGVKIQPSKLSHVIVAPRSVAVSDEWIKKTFRESKLYRSFEQSLEREGFQLRFMGITEEDFRKQLKEWIRGRWRPDGLLLLWHYCTPELAELLRTHAIAHVSPDFTIEHLDVNTICDHSTAGMRKIIEHLVKLGHRRIGFMGPKGFYRYPMMASAMAAMDLPIHPGAVCWFNPSAYPTNGDQTYSHREREAARIAFGPWFDSRPGVTALVCADDPVAFGVLEAMKMRGLTAGRDLSVTGYDDLESHDPKPGATPILTTVHSPFERIGRRMAELLLNQILHGQTPIVHERVPVSLVVRQTTGPAPGR